MILPAYLESEIMEFCRVSNIPVSDGNIPKNRQSEIWDFVKYRMKKDRNDTRAKEWVNSIKVSPLISKIIGTIEPLESPIEEYLREGLDESPLKGMYETQYNIGSKRVDFAFPSKKLVVECDGKDYHYATTEQVEKDQARDSYLARKGWRVLHIEGKAIRTNIDLCIKQISEAL